MVNRHRRKAYTGCAFIMLAAFAACVAVCMIVGTVAFWLL